MNTGLKAKVEEYVKSYNDEAMNDALDKVSPDDVEQQREERITEIVETMNDVLKAILDAKEDTDSISFTDDFYNALREVLLMKPFVIYDDLRLPKSMTDETLAPYAAEIEAGDLSRVHPLLITGKSYVTDGVAVFNNFRIVISNLHFIILAFAHRAKHFDSFAAGEKFLRAASIAQRFTRNFFHIAE